MCPHPGRADPLHQLGVLVDQPRLAKHVRGGVFQLRDKKELIKSSQRTVLLSSSHPLCELSVHHEVVDVFFGPRKLQLPRHHGNEKRRAAGALEESRISLIIRT